MMQQVVPLVAIVGGASCSEKEAQLAYEVGTLLAGRGVGVVCGGRDGVMAAVCRGAMEKGGMTVGILPGETFEDANPWVQVAIATGLGEACNAIVARAGVGVIAVGGEFGTLSEIALALKWGKRVAGLGTWEIDGVYATSSPAEAVAHVLDEMTK